MSEAHEGAAPPVTLEILKRFVNNDGVCQAAEAVCIREERPKFEWKGRLDESTEKTKRGRKGDVKQRHSDEPLTSDKRHIYFTSM